MIGGVAPPRRGGTICVHAADVSGRGRGPKNLRLDEGEGGNGGEYVGCDEVEVWTRMPAKVTSSSTRVVAVWGGD